jgi:hypothetical protein
MAEGNLSYINIAFEDILSEAVITRILSRFFPEARIARRFHGRGSGYLKLHLQAFVNGSRHIPYFVLIDSDRESCAKKFLTTLIKDKPPRQCMLRIAVHEVESWLLADFNNLLKSLKIQSGKCFYNNTDEIERPKEYILKIIDRGAPEVIKKSLIHASCGGATQGPGYNSFMVRFAMEQWNIDAALYHSESLKRAVECISNFRKTTRPL